MSDEPGKRRRGRPKGRRCSAKELAQRRKNVKKYFWRHGRHARGLLRVAPPCAPEHCPMNGDDGTGYPCDAKRYADDAGAEVDVCMVEFLRNQGYEDAFRRALDGDNAAYELLASKSLAAAAAIEISTAEDIFKNGLGVTEDVYDSEGAVVGERKVTHPGAKPWLELRKQLGMTAADMGLTRKARGEEQVQRSIASLADTMRERRRQMAAEQGDAS